MSLKQKTVLVCVFSLLFSSCATIQESTKNDDVLLKEYTVKENTGYQYTVSYQFRDSAKFNDVSVEASIKKYQMCETEDRGIYDRTEITERRAVYEKGIVNELSNNWSGPGDLGDCYSIASIYSLIVGIGILLFPVCITDSFRAMDSSRHIGEVTKTIQSSEPNRCDEVSPGGTQVTLTLNDDKTFTKSADASGNVIFTISELGESAKEFHNTWASLKAEKVEKDVSIPETIQYHWIDRDYEIALKQDTVDGYQTFLQTYPQSKYTDVIASRLTKQALRQAEKAVHEKDWEDAYSYWKIAKGNTETLTNGEKKEFDRIEKFLKNNIASKDEAYEFFPPEQFRYETLVTNPWSLMGKYIEIEGIVFQRLGVGSYLIRLGGTYMVYVDYLSVSGNQLMRELTGGGIPNGAPVKILGNVVGSKTYETAIGGTNTVPWLFAKWIEVEQ
ncbi:MAG: hypothetical protein M1381_09295 [Deltaproteobacteria bacterium]|nr:hypothetical protein [Deltaproteobacteria bacterium]